MECLGRRLFATPRGGSRPFLSASTSSTGSQLPAFRRRRVFRRVGVGSQETTELVTKERKTSSNQWNTDLTIARIRRNCHYE